MEAVQNGIATVARKSKAGELIEWVAQARSFDDTRYFMTGVHVEPHGEVAGHNVIVATDGRRLHYATIPEDILEPGEYLYSVTKTDIVLTRPSDGSDWPDWHRVIPETTQKTSYIAQTWSKGDGHGASTYACELVRDTGANLNFQYLFDLGWKKQSIDYAVGMCADSHADSSPYEWTGRPQSKALSFDAKDRHAVIMPMTRD